MTTTLTDMPEILESHKKWLADPKTGTRAYLRGANLRDANLRDADLAGADLYGANLTRANLYGAILYGANLAYADLTGANLYGANLYGANLRGANLTDATGVISVGTDRRGYRFVGILHADGWRVAAGCRWFTMPEAVAHWTAGGNRDALARLAVIQAATPESTP